MRNSGPKHAAPRGFTLVETIVALGLGVLLLVAVQRVIVHVCRTTVAIEQLEASELRQALPFELLAADLDHRLPGDELALGARVLRFGSAHALQNPHPVPRHAVQVAYETRITDNSGLTLERTEWEIGAARVRENAVELSNQLKAVTFEIHDGRAWHQTWPPAVPRSACLLRMTLQWTDGTVRSRTFRLAPPRWSRHHE